MSRTITLASGRKINQNDFRARMIGCTESSDRIVVNFFHPLEPMLEDAEGKELIKWVVEYLDAGYDGSDIVGSAIYVPNESMYIGTFNQRRPKAIREKIKHWLSSGLLVREGEATEINCGTCPTRGRSVRLRNGSLQRLTTDKFKCRLCALEDLHNQKMKSGERCEPCGMLTSTVAEKQADGTTRRVCERCARYYVLERECWNCGESCHTSTGNTYLMFGLANPQQGCEMTFCERCNYVKKGSCQICASAKATCSYTDKETGTVERLCKGCKSNKYATCAVCDKEGLQSHNLFRSVESYYNEDTGETRESWVCVNPCLDLVPRCPSCEQRRLKKELDNFGGVCETCADNRISTNVMYYRENVLNHVEPKGEANRKLGVELELEWNRKDGNNVGNVVQAMRDFTSEFGIIKRDGSLTAGIEFVTTPCTLQVHQSGFWQSYLEVFGEFFQAERTCGLHVHVSKAGMTNTGANKLLRLVYYNPTFWTRVAGRESKRYATIRDITFEKATTNRYTALNVLNPNTFEFRMFNASTDADYIIARIELCDAAVRFCNSRLSDVDDMSLTRFFRYVKNNRRLYPRAAKLFRAADLVASKVEVDLAWQMWALPARRRGRPRRARARRFGGANYAFASPQFNEPISYLNHATARDTMPTSLYRTWAIDNGDYRMLNSDNLWINVNSNEAMEMCGLEPFSPYAPEPDIDEDYSDTGGLLSW